MKYQNKCAYCSRKADKKFRGEYFCNDCAKMIRRKKINAFLGKEKLVATIGPGIGIYRDYPVYLK